MNNNTDVVYINLYWDKKNQAIFAGGIASSQEESDSFKTPDDYELTYLQTIVVPKEKLQ